MKNLLFNNRAAMVVIAALVVFSQPVGAASGQLAPQEVLAAVEKILTSPQRLPFHLQRFRKSLTAHYVTNKSALHWYGTDNIRPFVQRMILADADGLKPHDYPADYLLDLRHSINPKDPVAAAFTELTFSSFFIKYVTDLKTGRFVPQKIDPDLFQPKRPVNRLAVLQVMAKSNSPGAVLDSLQPHNRHYRLLKPLLAKYREIVEKGGWQKIDFGPTLKPGMSDPRIPLIRKRLEMSGDLRKGSSGAVGNLYDDKLARAVMSFQRRVGLNDEGIIGKLSLIQMNVSAAERMRQIIVNMERWRWMPEHMGANHIMVNIAAFRLYRVVGGKQVDTVNVVVGKKFHQTPVFSDEMEYVVLNPTWTVPYSIATKELLPKLQNNPSYLKADFEVLQSGQPVSPFSIDWTEYSKTRFPFVFRQRPGPKNALGEVKFIFPNSHAIYLHDTPSKALFKRSSRAFSHGCIRVYQPLKLAEKILSSVPGWNHQRIYQTIASRELTQVNLPRHIPIHIVYATVWAGKNGAVEFRPDIYGRDRKLYRALFAKPTS